MRFIYFILILFLYFNGFSQVGGKTEFKSLDLPLSPVATGLGGAAMVSSESNMNRALENPSMIDSNINNKLSFNNAFYIAGSNYGSFGYGFSTPKTGNFLASLHYITFGSFTGTDINGNILGNFRAGDYTLSMGYGRNKGKFYYGANLKFIYSHIETYHAMGLGVDLAATYFNPDKSFMLSLLVKNLGYQLVGYVNNNRSMLPLNLSLGLSKKFEGLPVRVGVIAHNLQSPKISYAVDEFGNQDFFSFDNSNNDIAFLDKMFRHLIFNTEVYIAKVFTLRLGYNHLQRKEAGLSTKRGFAGISVGAGFKIKQFSIDYGFSNYHVSASSNHLGMIIDLNQFGM